MQRMSPGLLRARAPYRNKNIAVGILLFGAVTGIYFYSMQAVKQDDFTDVDAEATAMRGTKSGAALKSIEDEERERKEENKKLLARELAQKNTVTSHEAYYGGRRGILAQVAPNLMASRITWIDGAPPIDRIGLMGDRRRISESSHS